MEEHSQQCQFEHGFWKCAFGCPVNRVRLPMTNSVYEQGASDARTRVVVDLRKRSYELSTKARELEDEGHYEDANIEDACAALLWRIANDLAKETKT